MIECPTKKKFLIVVFHSCQPEQAIDPFESTNTSGDFSKDSSLTSDEKEFFIPTKKESKKANKSGDNFQELLGMIKTVLEKDPVSEFLKFAREQEERQHALTVIKLLMGPPPAQMPVPNLQNQLLNNMPPCNNAQ